jgi:hypothetical protein
MLRTVSTAMFLAFSLILLAVRSSAESNPALYVASWQFNASWECSTDVQLVLAGGREGMRACITNLTTPHYPSLEEGWPHSMTITAGSIVADSFVQDPLMLSRLQISRLIGWRDFADDSMAHARGEMSYLQRIYGVCYGFSLNIPEEYIGQRIYIQATYDTSETGRLTRLSALDVAAPCDDKARQIMQGSFVLEANFRGEHERAVQIADSLVALGWRDLRGLVRATQSAMYANRPADALRFLDFNFEANGRIETDFEDVSKTPGYLQTQARLYRETRQRLVEQVQMQQQQQQR